MDTFVKFDSAKPATQLLPPRALIEVSKVLEYGARKYAPNNWRNPGVSYSRYYGATLRHLFAFWNREEVDAETELDHLSHATTCLLFLLELKLCELAEDDRP